MTPPLSTSDLAKYRSCIESAKYVNQFIFIAGVADVESMLDEIEASRLKIEQLCEKISELREGNASGERLPGKPKA